MTEYISDVDRVVTSPSGASALFQAGVARPLREALVPFAAAVGVRPVDGAPVETDTAELTAEQVAEAIRKLMASGDSKAFGTTGEPKLAALRKVCGPAVDDALRDAAWAIVKAEQPEE